MSTPENNKNTQHESDRSINELVEEDFEDSEIDNISDDEDSINEEDYVEKTVKKGLYPREYFDPCDIYLNKKGQEEYYFNMGKTLKAHHLGFLWKILPDSLKEKIDDWVWDKDFLHDIAVKQHLKIENLNSSTASVQLSHDISVIFVKLGIAVGLIVGIISYNHFIYTPNKIFNEATQYLNNKNYSEAIVLYESLGTNKNANLYLGFCKAQLKMSEKKFDEAKDIFIKLKDYSQLIGLSNIDDYIKEADYQKALSYYNAGDWQATIDTLVPIIKYSNALEYYEKCQYKMAEIDYENQDYYSSLEKFSSISSYEDTQERMNRILSNIYAQGIVKYNENDYMGAAEIFNSIVKYEYKDSGQMSTQCFYKSAQDLFKEKDYYGAMELFEQIPHYKDSQTMVKECIYLMLDNKDYTKNILNILSLGNYRDVAKILQTAPYNLYAEWIISDINGVTANNETFIFNTEGNLLCSETRLPNIAVSTDEVSYPYSWNGEYFSTEDDRYQIYIDDYTVTSYITGDITYITLRCCSNSSESIYRCQKLNELDEYYEMSIVPNNSDTSDYELIQLYLDNLNKKEQSEEETDELEVSISEGVSIEPEDSTSDDVVEETNEPTLKTFSCEVLRVFDDSLLVAPEKGFNEYEISGNYIVLYEHSTDLEVGDIISLMYKEEINKDVEPYEITAYKVKYLESIYDSDLVEETSIPKNEEIETTEQSEESASTEKEEPISSISE